MHAALRRTSWLASRYPARTIAGRRYSAPTKRFFHISPTSRLAPSSRRPDGAVPGDSAGPHESSTEKPTQSVRTGSASEARSHAPTEEVAEEKGSDEKKDKERERSVRPSSGLRRSTKRLRTKEIDPINIPAWFLQRNVRLDRFDKPLTRRTLDVINSSRSSTRGLDDELPSSSHSETTSTETRGRASHEQAQAFVDKIRDCVSIVQRDAALKRGVLPSDEDAKRKLATERDHLALEIRQQIRLARRNSALGGLLQSAEREFPELRETLRKYWRQEILAYRAGRQTPTAGTADEADHSHVRHKMQEHQVGNVSHSEGSSTLTDFTKRLQDIEKTLRGFDFICRNRRDLARNPKAPTPYGVTEALMNEVLASFSAGLSPSNPVPITRFPNQKTHLKLVCANDGGVYFLDSVVEYAATKLNADIIRIDAQDLAKIAGDYINEGPEASSDALWTLGYDTGPFFSRSGESEHEIADDEEGDEFEAVDDGPSRNSARSRSSSIGVAKAFHVIDMGGGQLGDLSKKLGELQKRMNPASLSPRGGGGGFPSIMQSTNGAQAWNDLKLTALLESLLQANTLKDEQANSSADTLLTMIQTSLEAKSITSEPSTDSATTSPQANMTFSSKDESSGITTTDGQDDERDSETGRKTVLYIRGIKELGATPNGNRIVDKLVDLVQKKRLEGQNIMVVGGMASTDMAPELVSEVVETIQTEEAESVFRTVVVMPAAPKSQAARTAILDRFLEDRDGRVAEINLRHMHSMIQRLEPSAKIPDDWVQFADDSSLPYSMQALEDKVLSADEVHRLIFTAIGRRNLDENSKTVALKLSDIFAVMKDLEESDDSKSAWATPATEDTHIPTAGDVRVKLETQSTKAQSAAPAVREREVGHHVARPDARAHIKKATEGASRREKALLRGVIDPQMIRTSFDDVHAPPETKEALRSLTMLSLMRPEAFKYGVLATDRISGLLLYGPPGTGKTLLAKAVAKECGATMLEVSGADLWNMYVGEAEKNVKAVFSLAKKLAPCVVFIDEADAIFASRGSGAERKSHRELINQFLKEWDGMNESTAFIMVATNRPFDLDDAALRRLPRRILVDLPTEKDREAILRIHLKGEQLDDSVSISKLAEQTPLYSGSDLKNVAVAAALAAVREENAGAAKHTGVDPYTYPEKRTLRKIHFDSATEEISASVNEDMSSLSAIKKFDEKYGDRRGRRKKTAYGFGGDLGDKQDTAKVRT